MEVDKAMSPMYYIGVIVYDSLETVGMKTTGVVKSDALHKN